MQVKGKQVTDTPEILLKSELTYDNGAFFASANVNYTDERFYTYLNQGSVDAYTLVNLGGGLSLPRLRRVRGAVDPAGRDQPHRQGVLQHDRLERLHRVGPERNVAVAAARRAAAVLPVGQSEVLKRRCREKKRGETAHRSMRWIGGSFAAVFSFTSISLPAPFLLSPV